MTGTILPWLAAAGLGLALVAAAFAHAHHDDAIRVEMRECRAALGDARTDRDHEHAVADACLRVVERCGVAVDTLCEGEAR